VTCNIGVNGRMDVQQTDRGTTGAEMENGQSHMDD